MSLHKTEACEADMHHKAFFSFEPTLFLADLGNIVSSKQAGWVVCVIKTAAELHVPFSQTHTTLLHAGFGLQHIWYPPVGKV